MLFGANQQYLTPLLTVEKMRSLRCRCTYVQDLAENPVNNNAHFFALCGRRSTAGSNLPFPLYFLSCFLNHSPVLGSILDLDTYLRYIKSILYFVSRYIRRHVSCISINDTLTMYLVSFRSCQIQIHY